MRKLPLSNSKDAVKVDDEDYPLLSRHKWYINVQGYAALAKKPTVLLHYFVMGTPPSKRRLEVDHVDRNRLNNCKSNLRWATREVNSQNQASRGGSSRYRGVYLNKRHTGTRNGHKWVAQITWGGVTHHLGNFHTEDEAARAYDRKVKNQPPDLTAGEFNRGE